MVVAAQAERPAATVPASTAGTMGAPRNRVVLGVKQHGRNSSGEKIQKINALRNALIHSHDSRHPDHQNTAAANAKARENSTDQTGGAGD